MRGLTHIDFSPNRAGDIAEGYATVALMAKGATVFRNTGCDGKTDLCFKYAGSMYEVDVKLAHLTTCGNGSYVWKTKSASDVKAPIYPLIVMPKTFSDLSGWSCRWLVRGNQHGNPVCPPGLENFWD